MPLDDIRRQLDALLPGQAGLNRPSRRGVLKAAMAAGTDASRASQFAVHADAPHAFHADYRPTYRKNAAEDGWQRCLAWFARHGVGT